MKVLFSALLVISTLNAFESTNYDFLDGKTEEEIKGHYLGLHPDFLQDTMLSMFMTNKIENLDLPESFDWREKSPDCIHPVRDQGKCGSCWAHGASEVVSDRFCIHSNKKINTVFSPQQLVDCDLVEMGCMGGFLTTPFIYYSIIGASEESCYGEYISGKTSKRSRFCFLKKWSCKSYRTKLLSIRWLTSPTAIKEELFKNGPVNTGFTVYQDFMTYKSGVYEHKTGGMLGGHAVKIIGWGKENNEEYWIVQNSWTSNWGEKGYFRIKFGQCGIDSGAVSVMPWL